MREAIHNAATLGMDLFVITLLGIAASAVIIYVGLVVFQSIVVLFGEVKVRLGKK